MRQIPIRSSSVRPLVLSMLLSLLPTACGGPDPTATLSPEEQRELAARIGFEEAVVLAANGSGGQLRQLEAMDAGGQAIPVDGLSLTLTGDAIPALKGLRRELNPFGYQVFIHHRGFGFEPDRLAILKDTDPFAIVKLSRTDGINYDIEHEAVLARLQEWHARYGLDILGADLDWVEAEFVNPPSDMQTFALEVFEFCPDVVHQGTGSVEALAKEMRSSNTLYLWWD